LADPLVTNSNLGTWTNFVNLADLCALAIPAGTRSDGLPFGLTLIGGAWEDETLGVLGQEWERGAAEVQVAVVGAHLSGLPLNRLLTNRGGRLVRSGQTAPHYKLFALEDQTPPKPGLVKVAGGGAAIALEVWSLPRHRYGEFVAEIPPPLGIGTIDLDDGSRVQGFLCEPWAIEGKREITSFRGWKAWLARKG
jgi:allophanate hydrolase